MLLCSFLVVIIHVVTLLSTYRIFWRRLGFHCRLPYQGSKLGCNTSRAAEAAFPTAEEKRQQNNSNGNCTAEMAKPTESPTISVSTAQNGSADEFAGNVNYAAPAETLVKPEYVGGSILSLTVPQFPALGSQQRLQTDQDTGKSIERRNKVPLLPKRSLIDWIRLGNSGEDLTGVGGKVICVSPEELAEHNKEDDCWMCLKGKVYNVTPYMLYHPGGPEELMQAAGKDGSYLFNEVHRWVNIESMLGKCLVGKMVGIPLNKATSRLFQLRKESFDSSSSERSSNTADSFPTEKPLPFSAFLEHTGQVKPRFDWFQTDSRLTIVVYTKWEEIMHQHIIIDKKNLTFFVTIFVKDYSYEIHVELEAAISDNYVVKVGKGNVNIVLEKVNLGYRWTDIGKHLSGHDSWIKTVNKDLRFRNCKLLSKSPVSHDTYVFGFHLPEGCRMSIPIGYHVYIRGNVNQMDITRPYTAALSSLDPTMQDPRVEKGIVFYLMIKIYKDGLLTPYIDSLVLGDILQISTYEGTFNLVELDSCSHLTMFAAGTGFTPMICLIYRSMIENADSKSKVTLVFFNKTEKDILWRSSLDKLLQENKERFTVHHVLSQPSNDWNGLKGRINEELVKKILAAEFQADINMLVCICGPTAFTDVTSDLLKKQVVGHKIHVFH